MNLMVCAEHFVPADKQPQAAASRCNAAHVTSQDRRCIRSAAKMLTSVKSMLVNKVYTITAILEMVWGEEGRVVRRAKPV